MKIEWKNATFGYGEIPLFLKTSLEFPEVEMLMISGESASGKSTAASLISGRTRPTSGSIFLNGQSVDSMSSSQRKKIGTLIKTVDCTPFPDSVFNVEEYLFYSLTLSNTSTSEASVLISETLSALSYSYLRDSKLDTLSNKECATIRFASGLCTGAEVFIFDDADCMDNFTVLWQNGKKLNYKLRNDMRCIAIGTRFSESDKKFADRICVISGKQILQLHNHI